MDVVVINKQERAGHAATRVNRRRLARLARAVMAAEGCHRDAELSVVIGDDTWIQDLNRKYRNKDAPTDVLAFPQDRQPPGGSRLLGDVVISAETAARQAKKLGHGFEEETAILLAHGILHLTGWRDDTPDRKRRMMRRVRKLLAAAQAESRLPSRRGQ